MSGCSNPNIRCVSPITYRRFVLGGSSIAILMSPNAGRKNISLLFEGRPNYGSYQQVESDHGCSRRLPSETISGVSFSI